ncbi:hypothetical protein DL96DRAFT_1440046, partial [Flagelloscypha sp. PMI_526]
EWTPYPSKIFCILDILCNLARLRLSSTQLTLILWAMKMAGTPNVPSLYTFRKVQTKLCSQGGVPSIECKSSEGNVFFMNDIRKIIAHDWTNPQTRRDIHVYPEILANGVISEVWHANKWCKCLPIENLSPMLDAGHGRHFFVSELARTIDNQLVIPQRWVLVHQLNGAEPIVYCDAYPVTINASTHHIHDGEGESLWISSKALVANYLDLKEENGIPSSWSDETQSKGLLALMPNKWRVKANGNPIYFSQVDFFGDDVSGNKTKAWNKHNNVYFKHRNLPRKLLHQEFHTHLASTSQYASISEQYREFFKLVESTHTSPIQVKDDEQLTTCIVLQVHSAPSDNPAQAESSSSMGTMANHPCRKCTVSGLRESKESDFGFNCKDNALPGIPRTALVIKAELNAQLKLACKGVKSHIVTRQRESGVKDSIASHWIEFLLEKFKRLKNEGKTKTEAELECSEWLEKNEGNTTNQFLSTPGFDPAKDTPVEILHTILLGVVKYIWFYSHDSWTAAQKELYSICLRSTDPNGLHLNGRIRAQYIIDFANSLIGCQLKTVIEASRYFHVYDIVDEPRFTAWKAVGELFALLWFPEYDHEMEYMDDLAVASRNVQDAFACIDPTKILSKLKVHLLCHIPEDVKQFGPLLGEATEGYESFNAVFRACSILSNHKSPSRDIACQMSDQESMKHRLMGGLFPDQTTGTWASAGPAVLAFVKENPALQRFLGWTVPKEPTSGMLLSIVLSLHRSVKFDSLSQTQWKNNSMGSKAVNASNCSPSSIWMQCKEVVSSVSLESCPVGSWVFAMCPILNQTVVGCIEEILSSSSNNIVVLQYFDLSTTRDAVFSVPVLTRPTNSRPTIVPTKRINVQHNCRSAGCTPTGTQAQVQEQHDSGIVEGIMDHNPLESFLLNLYSPHNPHLVRRVLPRSLIQPVPLFPLDSRRLEHNKIAAQLRDSQ